jgi:hypothetical protein
VHICGYSREAQEVIRRNLAEDKLSTNARVAAMEAAAFLNGTSEQFDIAF